MKSNLGNTTSHFFTTQGFHTFRNREISTGVGAIREQLANLDLKIIIENSLVEWEELGEEEHTWNEWEDRKVGRRKDFLVRCVELAKNFIRTNIEPEWMVLCLLPVLPPELRPIIQIDGVIYRNNTLTDLLTTSRSTPGELVMCQEKLVQEAVDTLRDNGIRGQPMRDSYNKVYKSFSDVIEGKEGRFRETLLGKQVDYSRRSVIVVGPSLSLHRYGLPREISIELFQTFAFQPVLVEGSTICLHPLVCKGFNVDFDGDQMAVHVPLSLEAQVEARLLIFSHMNLLSPNIGDPISVPMQHMLIGHYVLTSKNHQVYERTLFSNSYDAIGDYRQKRINLESPLWLRWQLDQHVIASRETPIEKSKKLYRGFLGPIHMLPNSMILWDFGVLEHFGMAYTSHILDQVKTLGFQQATATSISLGIDDLLTIPSKGWLVQDVEQQSLILEKHHHYGNVHAAEKLRQSIEIWSTASEYLRQEMNLNFRMTDPFNPVYIMSFSGGRGNAYQVHQLVEYIIFCYGACRVVDTTVRTLNAGYFTSRLIEVVQHIIVRRTDCGTARGIFVSPQNGIMPERIFS
ncbi:hypothetical protein H5410_046568 [Solanum commersonii]|uniref:DNA-directed RNA polymerase subunit n=1 Tax=Solanum commersonii TaxID=4109 RepID=A0A9J5XG28_SOLCO|nr:hypothetical protein H5410_046568 [Solanum commersonii]